MLDVISNVELSGMNLDQFFEDTRPFKSPSTTLFYLYLVLKSIKHNGQPFMINARNITLKLGITNPYAHMSKLEKFGYIDRRNLGVNGTQCILRKSYVNQ